MAKGFTQVTLAKAAGVSQQLIWKLETGAAKESRKLPAIAAALSMTAEELLESGIREPRQSYHGVMLTRAAALLAAEWEKLDVADRAEIESDILTRVAKTRRTTRAASKAR